MGDNGKYKITSLKSLLAALVDSKKSKTRYCFIIGSGASKQSGIRTGEELAKIWYNEIQENFEAHEINAWRRECNIPDNFSPGEYYSKIYQYRFSLIETDGYAFLEDEMCNKEPSCGYYYLSRFITETESNLVITTNFDSLMEDAIFIYTSEKPITVMHESLAGYIRVMSKRPVIAKIHRGLFFEPNNTDKSTGELPEQWKKTLSELFAHYIPIVIGYGGNDGSLMGFLDDDEVKIKNMFWCYLSRYGEPSPRIIDVVNKRNGSFVPIEGFDEMMIQLGGRLKYDNPESIINEIAKKRIDTFHKQIETAVKNVSDSSKLSAEQVQVKESLMTSFEKEIKELTEKINKTPNEADLYFKRGRAYYLQEDSQAALENFNKAIDLKKDDADVFFYRGNCYYYMKEYDKALQDYNKALGLNPNHANAYNNRGFCYYELKEYDKALQHFNKALELNPNYVEAHDNRGLCYYELKEYDKALQDFNKALELNPNYVEAYNNRGLCYYELKEYDKALQDFNKALELNHNYAVAYNNRGLYYYKLKEYDKALQDFNKASELNPNEIVAYNNRGEVYKILGEDEKAQKDFAKANELRQK